MDNYGFARIPFAVAAVAILTLSAVLAGVIMEISTVRQEYSIERTFLEIDDLSRTEESEIEAGAHYSLQKILFNITSVSELDEKCLNQRFTKELFQWLDLRYPKETMGYVVDIKACDIFVVEDWMNCMFPGESGNGSTGYANPVYLKLAGTASISITMIDNAEICVLHEIVIEKPVPAPLPLIANSLKIFRAQNLGGTSNVAALVKYILTSSMQLKILAGEFISGFTAADIISYNDVETALSIAVLLEQARIFRTYDKNTAELLGITDILSKYLDKNEIDAAELFSVLKNLKNMNIELGTIMSEAISVYTDEFLYRVYSTFFGDPAPNAALSEPLTNWSMLQAKGEDYAKKQILQFLDAFRQWLLLPPFLFSHAGTSKVHEINRHATGIDEVSKYPVPLPVRGSYDLFSWPLPAQWFIVTDEFSTDDADWPPQGLFQDTLELILGEAHEKQYRSKPFKISYISTFGMPKTVKYHLINESFLKLYTSNNSITPYFDCLKNIIEILKSGIVEDNPGQGTDLGLMGLMRDDANYYLNREFPKTTIKNHSYFSDIMVDALAAFRKLVRQNEMSSMMPGSDSWFEKGFLKKNTGNKTPYKLFVDVVDLFYELFWTLKQSSEAQPGNLDGNWGWNFPDVYYAPLNEHQVKSFKSEHFNFKRDAVKHAYNSVWTIVLSHLVPNRNYFHPDGFSPGKFEFSQPPIPEEAWLLYGWDKYPWNPSCSNLRLWDDVKKAVSPALNSAFGNVTGIGLVTTFTLKILNLTTDSRGYGNRFYDFLWFYIGREIIGPKSIKPASSCEQLISKKNGWLAQMLLDRLPSKMNEFYDYENIAHITELSELDYFWFKESYDNEFGDSTNFYKERLILNQTPSSFFDCSDLEIAISDPKPEPRFVSVYEETSELSGAPFVTTWTVSLKCRLDIEIRTVSKNLICPDGYRPLGILESVPIDFAISISLFSGWPLSGLKYPKTITVLGLNETNYKPDMQLSTGILNMLDARIVAESNEIDRFELACELLLEFPEGALRQFISTKYGNNDINYYLKRIFQPTYENSIPNLDADLINIFRILDKLNKTCLRFKYWGFNREFLLISNSEFQVISKIDIYGNNFSINHKFSQGEEISTLHFFSSAACLDVALIHNPAEPAERVKIYGTTSGLCLFSSEYRFDDQEKTVFDNRLQLTCRNHTIIINPRIISNNKVLFKGLQTLKTLVPENITTMAETAEVICTYLYELEELLDGLFANASGAVKIYVDYFIEDHADGPGMLGLSFSEETSALHSLNILACLRNSQRQLLGYLLGQNGGVVEELPAGLLSELNKKNIEISIITFADDGSIINSRVASTGRFLAPGYLIQPMYGAQTEVVFIQDRNNVGKYFGCRFIFNGTQPIPAFR